MQKNKNTGQVEEFIKAYLRKYFPFESLFTQRPERGEEHDFNRYKLTSGMRWIMAGLKLMPWLCMLGFGFTFGVILLGNTFELAAVSGFYQQYEAWITALNIVAISGMIGYGTNFIAIRMLFRPVQRRPIWGQGLIPGQKDRIIYTLAKGMHKHILSEDLIRKRVEETGLVRRVNDLMLDGGIGLVQDQRLRDELKLFLHGVMIEWSQRPQVRRRVIEILDSHLEEKVEESGLGTFIFQTYKRFNRDQYEEVINKITEELPKVALKVIDRMEEELDTVAAFLRMHKKTTREQIMQVFIDLLNRIDITDLLAKQMAHFDETRLERMIWEATNEQLLYIQYLGTVLGILGGLLIWRPALMGPAFVGVFLVLWGLDHVLFRWQQRRQRARATQSAAPVQSAEVESQ